MLTRRALTSCSTSRWCSSSAATFERGHPGPHRVAVLGGHHQAEQQGPEAAALGGSIASYSRSAVWDTADLIPPVAR